jgi:hypothetical protein
MTSNAWFKLIVARIRIIVPIKIDLLTCQMSLYLAFIQQMGCYRLRAQQINLKTLPLQHNNDENQFSWAIQNFYLKDREIIT